MISFRYKLTGCASKWGMPPELFLASSGGPHVAQEIFKQIFCLEIPTSGHLCIIRILLELGHGLIPAHVAQHPARVPGPNTWVLMWPRVGPGHVPGPAPARGLGPGPGALQLAVGLGVVGEEDQLTLVRVEALPQLLRYVAERFLGISKNK